MSWNSNYVKVTAQGRLLRVKVVGLDNEMPRVKRGERVDGFSDSSRLRLLKTLARIQEPQSVGYRFRVSFLTLTMREMYHPRTAKRFLYTFFKRLGRKYPHVSAVWRMEYQKRGAPHFHVILYNVPWVDKEHIQSMWGEVISQEKPFTRIERIKSYKHLVSYAAKYAAKRECEGAGFNSAANFTVDATIPAELLSTSGRVWGVYNRIMIPWAEETEAKIPLDGSWWLIRRYCHKFWPYFREDAETGFTVFCDDPYHALRHLVKLSTNFIVDG